MTAARTILVVDDDYDLCAGMEAVLHRHGYCTLCADDGLDAKKLIDSQRPDLVILDMMMPRLGGLAVLEHYRGDRTAPPFILITANESDSHRAYAEWIGVSAYLRKPFSLDRLIEQVDEVLQPAKRPAEPGAVGEFFRCRCPGCGARIRAPRPLLGQERPCPRCRRPVLARPAAPQDEEPRLVSGKEPSRRPGTDRW